MKSLTELEWIQVFDARCLSKQGKTLTVQQSRLCDRAFRTDRKRYGELDVDVFNATVPFASPVRRTKP